VAWGDSFHEDDVELNPDLIFDFHGATRDLNGSDAEIALFERRGASVVAIAERGTHNHGTGSAMESQISPDCPVVGTHLLNRGRPKGDFGEATTIEHLRAIHRFLNLGAFACFELWIQNTKLARVHDQSDARTRTEFDSALSDWRFNFVIVREGRKKAGLIDANLQHRVCYIDRAHLTADTNARQHARQGNH
jgi:hypothetical protein